MKLFNFLANGRFALALLSFEFFELVAQQLPGIPEPGLLLYGAVTNSNGGTPVPIGNVRWVVSGGGSTVSVDSTIVNVNGQYFYITRIPFETRTVPGLVLQPTPNTLPLSDANQTFTRASTVSGVAATPDGPNGGTFQFRKQDRGRVERVNLSVQLGTAVDTDGDGMPDWMELIAGTDPNDAKSVLKISSDVRFSDGVGLTIAWASASGKNYQVSRTSDLGQSFVTLADSISSEGATTTFTDSSATEQGPYFYRISVKQ